jgi:hypothetical protein
MNIFDVNFFILIIENIIYKVLVYFDSKVDYVILPMMTRYFFNVHVYDITVNLIEAVRFKHGKIDNLYNYVDNLIKFSVNFNFQNIVSFIESIYNSEIYYTLRLLLIDAGAVF